MTNVRGNKRKINKGYCTPCFQAKFPDKVLPRKYMLKEHHLRDFLKETYPGTKMVFNKTVGACSKRRPDVRIEKLTHTIIIECDEHAHKNVQCEEKRLMEIFQDLGNRPLVVIRFNPDKNATSNGCFTTTPGGALKLLKPEWHVRTNILKNAIDNHIKVIPHKELTVDKLFY
jgi:hypothetical protein